MESKEKIVSATIVICASAFLCAQPSDSEAPSPIPPEPIGETESVEKISNEANQLQESENENLNEAAPITEEIETITEPETAPVLPEELPLPEALPETLPETLPELPADLEELPPLESVETDTLEELTNPDELLDPIDSEENFDAEPSDDSLDSDDALSPIVVTDRTTTREPAVFGAPLAENPLLRFASPGTEVISGAALRRKLGATLGETLASEPGISASAYSPGVSRPVIRGFEGVRVRSLRDGLGTMDLSEDSPDHGVLVDTLLTEEIEIYRGPSSLLFGNSAIGGAINTRTRYIPSVADGEPFAATAIAGYDTQGDGFHFATAAELRSEYFAFGFSFSERSAGDISISGRARTSEYESLVQPRVFVPGEGSVPVPNPDGTLPNSFHESSSWSLGARLGSEDALSVGLSHHHYDSTYGIPYFFPGDEVDFFGDSSIAAELDRTDLEFSYKLEPGTWLQQAKLGLGLGDYAHDENFVGQDKDLGTNFTETAFQKDTFEGRLELYHGEEEDAFSGVFGAHFVDEDLVATRLIVPPPTLFEEDSRLESRSLGLFALEKWKNGPFSIQAGLRWDHREVSLTDQLGSSLSEKGSAFSQSLSASYEWTDLGPFDLLEASLTASHIKRLPTVIERYAFYNNAALGRFLVGGDLDGTPLDPEESTGLEFTLEAEKGNTSGTLSLFYYRFGNYIFLQDQRGVSFAPTAQYIQTSADFYGLEASLTHNLIEGTDDSGHLDLRFVGDIIRGIDTDNSDSPLPRIPAARLGMELTWQHPRWSASLETRYVFSQNRTAPLPAAELPTDDYLMINASLTWSPLAEKEDLLLSLRLNNLLDVDARNHTSFRKETSPLGGFGLSTEVRWSF